MGKSTSSAQSEGTSATQKTSDKSSQKSFFEEVIQHLSSSRSSQRSEARDQVLQMAEPTSCWHGQLNDRLDELARSKDPFTRGTAFLALGLARHQAAYSILSTFLDEPEADARMDLTVALCGLGEVAHAALTTLLKDPVFDIRFLAAQGLTDALSEAGKSLGTDESSKMSAREVDDALAIFIEGLSLDDTRFESLAGLHKLADPRALAPAQKVFGKFFISNFERVAAAGVLARLGDKDGGAFLLDRALRKKGLERGLAMELLAELKVPGFEGVLCQVADRPKDDFRGAALNCLGKGGVLSQLPRLKTALFSQEESDSVRADAAEGLAALGTASALDELKAFVADVDRHPDWRASHSELAEAASKALAEAVAHQGTEK